MKLDVHNLHVSFSIHGRKLQAVRGISFSISPGETVGIVGESGCGKTAAVQAITRLSPAASVSGSAHFEGRDLLQMNDRNLRSIRGQKIGMIFQDPMASLNPTMKIGAQIAEGLLYHKLASKQEAKRISAELLHLVGVPDPELRLTQYPHVLSGGMRQRVLIAIALACKPELLIADEPTTALDVTISAQILDLLKNLQKQTKSSLLLITHDLGVISSICDRVLVMYAGRIVEEGPVDQVLLKPRHPYTQLLLAATARLDQPLTERLIPIDGAPPNLLSLQKSCPFAPRCPYKFSSCSQEPPLKNSYACWKPHES
jgi:oligopeptide/dipeptide ABC transporter ATP-binding protein